MFVSSINQSQTAMTLITELTELIRQYPDTIQKQELIEDLADLLTVNTPCRIEEINKTSFLIATSDQENLFEDR